MFVYQFFCFFIKFRFRSFVLGSCVRVVVCLGMKDLWRVEDVVVFVWGVLEGCLFFGSLVYQRVIRWVFWESFQGLIFQVRRFFKERSQLCLLVLLYYVGCVYVFICLLVEVRSFCFISFVLVWGYKIELDLFFLETWLSQEDGFIDR